MQFALPSKQMMPLWITASPLSHRSKLDLEEEQELENETSGGVHSETKDVQCKTEDVQCLNGVASHKIHAANVADGIHRTCSANGRMHGQNQKHCHGHTEPVCCDPEWFPFVIHKNQVPADKRLEMGFQGTQHAVANPARSRGVHNKDFAIRCTF